jgi:hypothetical protein
MVDKKVLSKRKASKKWRENNKEKVLNKRYQERYGISYQDYCNLLKEQNHKCAICGIDEVDSRSNKLCVDHDHETGKVRQLLCHNCNCGLGHFQDNVSVLEEALKYLIKHKQS